MKKLLLPFLLFLGLTLVSGVLFGQTISYAPTNSLPLGSAGTVSPTALTGVNAFGYGAGTTLTSTGLSAPYGMAFDNATTPNLYVVNYTSGTVFKYAAGGGTPTSFITGLTNPTGIVFDSSGLPYVLTITGYVYKFPTTGGTFAANSTLVVTGNGGGTAKPASGYGLAIDASNNLYIADNPTGAIYKYTASTTVVTRLIYYNTGSNSTYIFDPVGVQVDAAGNIYTLDNSATRPIAKWTAAGAYSATIVPGSTFTNPFGFYMDKSGNFYISDAVSTSSNKIYAYNSSIPATLLTSFTKSVTNNSTRGIIADASGNLFVSDYGLNTVTKYAITGGCILNYAAGTTSLPAGITFNSASTSAQFKGTPTVAFTGNYTVTVYGASAVTSAQFSLNCGQPTISYAGSPYSFTVSSPISTVTPTVTGSPTITISPNITTNIGLAFSASTGAISGTPTTASGPVTYTITATNAGGSVTTTISVQVYVASPTIAYTGSPFSYGVGAAITTLSPSTLTGSPTTFAISPSLNTNTGLTFSTANGQISGTPTIASAATTYTISAYNTNPTPGTTTISIATVNPPTVSYTGSPYSFTVGTGITTITPGTTNSPTSFAISPSLNTNTGLTFSTSTGAISGTPTIATGPITYTITPSNAAGAGTATTISVQVYPASPTIAYTGSPFTYGNGVTITTLAPSTNTGSPTSYTISPSLNTNTGLTFSTANGQISGTPTIASAAVTYTISAYNANPTPGTTTISIAVVNPPTSITYTPALSTTSASPTVYTQGTVIPTETASVTGGTIPATGAFSLTNNATSTTVSGTGTVAVPGVTGLTFSYNTGQISGTPTSTLAASTSFTAKVTNAAGFATFTFYIIVYPPKPTISYTGSPYTYTVGTPITTLTPAVTNGPTTYTISPDITLNTGLTFTSSNGQISGTPTTVSSPAVTYTISAFNANPTAGTTTISVTVNQVAPVISYTTPDTYTVGASVSLPVTNNHSAVTTGYVITTGALPSGLSLNPTTGLISGTVNTVSAALTVTVTANTGTSSGTAPVSITVNDVAPSSITYSPSTNAYPVGVAITPLTPSVTGTIPAKYVYPAPTPAFNNPWGMGLNPANRLFVVDNGVNYVSLYSPAGAFISSINTGVAMKGIVFDASGNAYIAKSNGDVIEYDNTGALVGTLTTTPVSGWGIAIDASNNLYIADRSTGQVYKYNIATAIGSFITTTGITKPVNVAIDAAGFLYVLDNTANKVSKYSSTGGAALSTPVTGLTTPYGLSVDAAGNIYVGDSGTNSVKIYNSTGTLLNTISNIDDPRGVLVDSQGSIYVSDFTNNSVTKYAPRGGFSISPTTLPAGITFDTSTGTFSGTPTAVFAAVTYTVSVYNSGGSKSTTVTISCTANPPIIAYSTPPPSTFALPVNVLANLVPANTGGPIKQNFAAAYTSTVLTGGTVNTPKNLGIDPTTGYVYVANATTANGSFNVYNSNGAFVSNIVTTGISPLGVVFDASGAAYVLDATSKKVIKYPTGLGGTGTAITAAITTPYGIAIDGSGAIYVASFSGNSFGQVYKYTGSGTTYTNANIPFSNGPLDDVTDVAVDASGNVYMTSQVGTYANVVEYSATGATLNSAFIAGAYASIYIDASGNIYLTSTAGGKVYVYNSSATLLATITATTPYGVVADSNGNIFVSGTGNTVTEYGAPVYSINTGTVGALPAGLYFNTATGVISGTPTAVFTAKTYTVTAYGVAGSTGSTNITISCYFSYDWIGATADWQTASNWESKQLPTSSSDVIIGVNYPFTNAPVVSSTGSANAASVTFGNQGGTAGAAKLAGITVNAGYSLTVAGAITKQSDVNSATAYISTLSGGGTITAASLSVLPNLTATAAYADGITSTLTGTSPAAGLAITGNVTLTSASSPQPATLSFNVTGGVTNVAGTLSTNNASGSTSTFKVINGTLQLANSAALSALSSTGTNTLSFVNTGATIEYSGAAQTVYTDAAITGLAGGVIYQNIKFSGTGVKTPNGTATSNLNIQGDFTNALANTTASNVVLTGTIVNFNGSGVQNLYGGPGPTLAPGALTTAAPSPTGTVFGNVTINNPLAAANNTKNMVSGGFSIASNGVLTMVGPQSYTSLTTNGNLTLNSDATGSATVAAYSGPLIVGTVHVQRYITGGGATYRGYRLLSSPVAGSGANANKTDLSYIKYTSYLKGYNGTAGGWDAAGNPNLFLYRENLAPSNATFSSGNYRSITTLYTTTTPNYSYLVDNDGTTPYTVPTGTGSLFYFRGDRHADSIAVEGVAGYASQPAILTATGVLNHGAVSVTNWYTGTSSLLFTNATANSAVRGFNLVGNPYASTIDLMTASTTPGSGLEYPAPLVGGKGVETNFYELNPVSQNYDVWSNSLNSGAGGGTNQATRYIVSGQGFFVKADTINQRLTFNESAKVNNQNTGPQLFEAANPVNAMQNIRALKTEPIALSKKHNGGEHLRLQMALDSVNTDDIYIGFDPSAQTAYTFNQDALYKQGSGKVSLSSMSSDNVALAINVRPLAKPTNTIKLNVSALANGNYTLNMTELKEIPALYDVWLMDAYLKDSLDMRHNKTYSFTIALTDTNSFGAKRFSLVIREKPGKGVKLVNFIANKVINGAKVIWKTENELNYTNFVVQRSIDNGKTFDNLNAFVSNDEGSYSFLDTHPVMPADNYRLKITDLNGNVSYSDIAPLQYSNLSNNITKNAITIYPNPTVGPINMTITQTFKAASFGIQIVNSNGTVVHTTTSATPTWQADMSKLLPGTYVIQVMNNTDKTVVGKGTFVKL